MAASDSSSVILVGEGDFSFSVSFCKLHPDKNITSTTLLSREELCNLHKKAAANIEVLLKSGVTVKYGVDATKLETDHELNGLKFDILIFNFPHIGGKSNIKKNRQLLKDFFASGIQMITSDGDIVVTLAQGQGGTPADEPLREWHDSWQVVGAAAYAGMILTEVVPFDTDMFPDYNSTGFRSEDRPFFTKRALTYKFKSAAPYNVSPDIHIMEPFQINVDNSSYHTLGHVGMKMNRNLLETEDHPLNHTLRDFIRLVESADDFKVHQLKNIAPVVQSENGIKAREHLRYFLASCEKNQSNDSLRESSSLHNTALESQYERSLRISLCEQLEDILPPVLESERMYVASGDVYQRPQCGQTCLPVNHQVLGVSVCQNESNFEKFIVKVKSCLSLLLGNNTKILNTEGMSENQIQPEWTTDCQVLEVSYQSKNTRYMSACNQANPLGPVSAQNSKDSYKITKFCKEVGFCGIIKRLNNANIRKHDLMLFVLDLDALAQIRYDIPDRRCFWTQNSSFYKQFSAISSEEQQLSVPICKFPPLWRHDLSFWEDSDKRFDEGTLLDIIHEVSKGAVSQVLLMNVWKEPGTGRISRCYREIYQSPERPISHSCAHDIQNAIRLTVQKHLGVELR